MGVGRFVGSSVMIVFIHWIVTDIGVWLSGILYPMTLEGLRSMTLEKLVQ